MLWFHVYPVYGLLQYWKGHLNDSLLGSASMTLQICILLWRLPAKILMNAKHSGGFCYEDIFPLGSGLVLPANFTEEKTTFAFFPCVGVENVIF